MVPRFLENLRAVGLRYGNDKIRTVPINRYRYLVNNTTNISNGVYYRMITTTCFDLFRPSSGFHPKDVVVIIL